MIATILLLAAHLGLAVSAARSLPGSESYVVATAFPTSVFSSYYLKPNPTQEPQPIIYDPVLNSTFKLNLTDPDTLPTFDEDEPVFPEALVQLPGEAKTSIVAAAMSEILAIIASNDSTSDSCDKCLAALSVGQVVARLAPTLLPDAMVALCNSTRFASEASCWKSYGASNYGATMTQVLAYADITGSDGAYICAKISTKFCAFPGLTPYKMVDFPKEKPKNPTKPVQSGKKVKVLHLSDFHLDPRYDVGSEANCTSGLCCRSDVSNTDVTDISVQSPMFGYFLCDSPYSLGLGLLQSITPLTGIGDNETAAFSIYTGDMVSHDPLPQMSSSYVEYIETSIYHMFQTYIKGPIYCALGNHDSSQENQDAPHAIDDNGTLGQQFSWNYEHVSKLWEYHGWIDHNTSLDAAKHYAGYSIVHPLGLRIITLNSDMFYRGNYYTFMHTDDPDYSGMFSFLVQELQAAEDAGQRAWIVMHVLTGWDGSNPMPNPTDMFYQIVERYSDVIANVMMGHTHEDQNIIYYSNNATNRSADTALVPGWIGPSMTPLTNLNSGFRMYEVDTGTWDVMEAYTFYADVDTFSTLSSTGPTFRFEYSTRESYGAAADWPEDAPLNATFWHKVTEAMESNRTLVSLYNTHQGKSSVLSPNCTSDACAEAKVCYMRSASGPLGLECPSGFGSVQSQYTGKNF